MKVLFVCPSLESGRDGVGDYTRRLADELQGCGHDCLCVAVNDRHCSGSASMPDPDGKLPSLVRLSSNEPWSNRWAKLDAIVREFQPHWLSLQFVPWGFHTKGLAHSLGARLRRISAGAHLHVMCHELWLQGRVFSIKQRILGLFQKWAIGRLFAALQPRVVNTTLEYYRDLLSGMGVTADLLPLHGNIPISSSRAEGRAWLRSRLGLEEDDQCLGFFGEIHASIDFDALGRLVQHCRTRGCGVSVISAGQLSERGYQAWHRVTTAFAGAIKSHALGPLSEEEVSKYLHGLDVGLTSYPPEYVGKSGGVAAMLEHGLRVELLGLPTCHARRDARSHLLPEQAWPVSAAAALLVKQFSA